MDPNLILLYQTEIEHNFKTLSSRRIANGYAPHAACLFAAMFKYAKSDIGIFSWKLDEKIFGSEIFRMALQQFKSSSREVRVRIIVQEKPTDWIKELFQDRRIKLYETTTYKKEISNFSFVDTTGYRYEANREQVKAVACAFDPDINKAIRDNFEIAFKDVKEFKVSEDTK